MNARLFSVIIFMAISGSFRWKFWATADSFASIAQLEEIVNLELRLTESLEKFVELEKKRLDMIKQFAESIREATELVKIDGYNALENPIVSYAVIKRFANGWSDLSGFLSKDNSLGKCLIHNAISLLV